MLVVSGQAAAAGVGWAQAGVEAEPQPETPAASRSSPCRQAREFEAL